MMICHTFYCTDVSWNVLYFLIQPTTWCAHIEWTCDIFVTLNSLFHHLNFIFMSWRVRVTRKLVIMINVNDFTFLCCTWWMTLNFLFHAPFFDSFPSHFLNLQIFVYCNCLSYLYSHFCLCYFTFFLYGTTFLMLFIVTVHSLLQFQ